MSVGPTTAGMNAAERWRYLAGRQAVQSARLRAARDRYPVAPAGAVTAVAASHPRAATDGGRTEPVIAVDDPFLACVRQVVNDSTTILDVGAGSGRLALCLAPHVARIVAVDPDADALRELARYADELDLRNICSVAAPIESAVVPRCEVAISAFVLDTLTDAAPFLERLDELASRLVMICITHQSTFVPYHPVWSLFHDQPREHGPTSLDAVAIIRQFGADPVVRTIMRDCDGHNCPGEDADGADYRSIDEAVEHYRELLLLPQGPAVLAHLREVLPDWLARGPAGYSDPMPRLPLAVISWTPRTARDGAD